MTERGVINNPPLKNKEIQADYNKTATVFAIHRLQHVQILEQSDYMHSCTWLSLDFRKITTNFCEDFWKKPKLLVGIFQSTFLQLVNGSKNSVLNWVMKLYLFMCFFFFFCFWNTLERFSILFAYSYSLV